MEFEASLKEEFNILNKAGKDKVSAFLKECEEYINELDNPDIIENRMLELIKTIKIEKKFFFNQFKEIYPFVVSARKLMAARQPEDYFILL